MYQKNPMEDMIFSLCERFAGNYDNPTDVADDIISAAQDWKTQWEVLCDCNRILRYCVCP